MGLLFTPGVERALVEAAAWGSIEPAELEAPAVLIGLLTESECRAAGLLARLGIDQAAVLHHWPQLARRGPPPGAPSLGALDMLAPGELRRRLPRFSDETSAALAAARRRLSASPGSLTVATEHLLLGLAMTGREVAQWLLQQGMDPAALEADIHRRSGGEMTPADAAPHGSEIAIAESLDANSLAPGSPFQSEEEHPDRCPPDRSAASVGTAAGNDSAPATRDQGEQWQRPAVDRLPTPSLTLSELPSEQTAVFRVLDAAFNRAGEGLRTVEDFARFVLDDAHLTSHLKRLRHELFQAFQELPLAARLAARETRADVGAPLSTRSERNRTGLDQVLAANFARLQESLRSLEEFAKLVSVQLSTRMKQFRYQAYTLQRAVSITCQSLRRLENAQLYVLLDGCQSVAAFDALAQALIEAGVHVLQLRDKRLDDRTLLARAQRLRHWTARSGTIFIVNDRPDLARLSGADGLHIGQEEIPLKDARSLLGPAALIGVSTHSIEQARQAVLDGADYLGVGPVFPSLTKSFDQFPGLSLVAEVSREIRLPAFAIGGISATNVDRVVAAGLSRVAVSTAVVNSADPPSAVRELLGRILRSGGKASPSRFA